MDWSRKQPLVVFLFITFLMIGLSIGLRYLILGGANIVSLESNSLESAVENYVSDLPSEYYRPIYGKDYEIGSVKSYKDGWNIVALKPVDPTFGSAVIVLKKEGQSYAKILGPGTYFTDQEISSLPKEVGEGLKNAR